MHTSQIAKLEAADAKRADNLGQSVAISGTTMIAGANSVDRPEGVNYGAAYVFTLLNGQWLQQAKLIAADGLPNDSFGNAVAIDGDTAVVGASFAQIGSQVKQGAVYVFVRTGTTWSQQAKLVGPDNVANARFGYAVSISGDTVAVSAYGRSAAYVFVRTGSSWVQKAQFNVSGALFGTSIGISDNHMIVGGPGATVGGFSQAGAAYVYRRTGGTNGSWDLQTMITALDPALNARFGESVAIDGGVAIVGASGFQTAAGAFAGKAYSFAEIGTGWIQTQSLGTGSDASDNFGKSVSLSGLTAVVGIPGADNSIYALAGVSLLYKFSEGRWQARWTLRPSDPHPSALFGNSVSVSGETAVMGATGAGSIPTSSDSGAAYVFGFTACCATDFNIDTVVDDFDFVYFANSYEVFECDAPEMPVGCPADLNADGQVDDLDFVLFTRAYERYLCP